MVSIDSLVLVSGLCRFTVFTLYCSSNGLNYTGMWIIAAMDNVKKEQKQWEYKIELSCLVKEF